MRKVWAYIVWGSDVHRWLPRAVAHPIRFFRHDLPTAVRLYGPDGTETKWLAEQRRHRS